MGFLGFAASFLPLGRLWIKPLQAWMNAHSSPLRRHKLLPLDESFREALRQWSDRRFLESSVPVQGESPSIVLMTDASLWGWGAVLSPLQARGPWGPEELSHSMNWLELKAIHLALLHFLPQLEGRCVSLRSDNMTALSCVRRQGSLASPYLWSLSREILVLAWDSGIRLVPLHLQGSLNVLADKASRASPISTEWSLDDLSFQLLCVRHGLPQVDLMATLENAKISTYISPCPDVKAWGLDALSCDWDLWESIYLFPPFQLLPEVVLRLASFRGTGFLVAPLWASALWFPLLAERCPHRHPLREGHVLSQWTSEGLVELDQVGLYQLHAWIL